MLTVYAFSLAAALLFAAGSVVQQRAAAQAPPQDVMSWRLLLWLVRRRLWLVGVVTALVGNVFSATALGRGGVAVVEPLLATRLLFVIPMVSVWARRRPARRDLVAAAVTAAGLAVFIVAGHPSSPTSTARTSGVTWAIGIGVAGGLALAAAVAGRRLPALRRAPLLAGGAGILFGLQATLTSDADRLIGRPLTLLTTWVPYAVIAVAVTGTLFVQSAYELAPLPVSFPAQVTAEPISGVILGVTVLDGTVRLTAGALALEVVGLLAMVVGMAALARSPVVTGQLTRLQVRDEEGQAYRRERELFRDLQALESRLDRIQANPRPETLQRRDQRRLQAEVAHIGAELAALAQVLADLERLHRLPTATTWAPGGPVDDDIDSERFELALRGRARDLGARTGSLCARARSLLPTGT